MSHFRALGILLFLSCVVILPYTASQGTVRMDGYTYSGQAAYLATAHTFLPADTQIQREMHFLEHPLLFRWLQAGWFKLWGISEGTSKSLVALMGILLVLATYGIGATFFSVTCGFLAAVLLLLSPKYTFLSSLCMLDIPLVFFSSLAIYAALTVQKERTWPLLLSGLFIGCAILTKGPFGLLAAAIIPFYFFISRKFFVLKSIFFYLGALTPKLCIWAYNIALSYETPGITLNTFWRTANLPDHNYTFYIFSLFKEYLYLTPAFFFLPFIFKKLNRKQTEAYLTFLCWVVLTIAALSWAPSKKQGYYLLSINPAFALLFAVGLDAYLKEALKKKILQGAIFTAIALAFIFSTTPLKLHKYKIFKEASYYTQFYDLKDKIQTILDSGKTFYYTSGSSYIFTFLFPKEFNQKKFRFLDIAQQFPPTTPFYALLEKPATPWKDKNLFIIAETKNLYIVSTKPNPL